MVFVGVSFEALFFAALAVVGLGLLFNLVISSVLLHQQRDNEAFAGRAWAAEHRCSVLLVRALSLAHPASALLLSSGSFSLLALSAPLSELAERRFSLASLASAVLTDLPLFALNLLATLEILTNQQLRSQSSQFALQPGAGRLRLAVRRGVQALSALLQLRPGPLLLSWHQRGCCPTKSAKVTATDKKITHSGLACQIK